MRSNIGAAAHRFCDRKAALKQLVKRLTQSADIIGGPDRFFELTQNLRLAKYHRVQTTGNPKGVPGCLVTLKRVDMRQQCVS
jgi:hypothetical protein